MNPQVMFPLLGFALGVGISSWPFQAQICSLLGAGILLPALGRWPLRWRQYLLMGILAAAIGLSWALLRQPRPASDDIVHSLPCSSCQVQGTLEQIQQKADKVNLRIRAAVLIRKNQSIPVTGWVQAFIPQVPVAQLPPPGARILLSGKLDQPLPAMNFGEFSYREYLARQGVFTQMRVRQLELQALPASWHAPWLLHRFRQHLFTRFARHLKPDTAALLGCLILGEQAAAVPSHLEDLFARAGLQHVLAVSGFQVQLVVLAWMALARGLRFSRPWIAGFGLMLIFLYMALTGFPASVLRAGLVAGLGLLAWSCFRRIHPMQALMMGGGLMLCWRPSCFYEPGFQFSFLATAGLIWGATWLAEKLDFIPLPLAQPLAALLAAQIWVLPVQLYHFGEVSLLVIPANLWALLFITLLTWMSLGGLLIAWVIPELWGVLAPLPALLSEVFVGGVQTLAHAPFPVLSLFLSGMQVAVVLLLLFILPCLHLQTLFRMFPMLLYLLPLLPLMGAWREHLTCPLRVTYLYVGQGDAILIEGAGRTLLLDAGPRQERAGKVWDAGTRFILPYLRRRGIRALDVAVISHAHLDHYGGFSAVLDALPVRAFYIPAGSPSSDTYLELLRRIQLRGTAVHFPHQGESLRWSEDLTLTFWQGQTEAHGDAPHGINNQSLVLQLRHRAVRFLFTGDIEAEAESALLQQARTILKTDIYKIPHHGSDTSSQTAFIAAVQPRDAIVSVGLENRFGHPVSDVLERYRQVGSRVWRTDQQGAICVCSQGGAYEITAVQL